MVNQYNITKSALSRYRESYTASSEPRISVIIPVYDSPAGLERSVRSIVDTTFKDYEICIVVTPSDGTTLTVARELAEEFPSVSVHIENQYETPGSARNIGIDASNGEIIQFLDDDMTLEDQYLWKLSYVFDNTDVDYLGCAMSITVQDEASVPAWYDAHIRFPVKFFMEIDSFCPTCCLSVRREALTDDLAFDPSLISGEDVVFGHHADAKGLEFGYCPDMTLNHPARTSTQAILRKGVKTGKGFYQLFHRPEKHLRTRSRLLSLDSYLPPSRSEVSQVCSKWQSLSVREKTVIYGLYYAEKLARTSGYVIQLLRSRLGR